MSSFALGLSDDVAKVSFTNTFIIVSSMNTTISGTFLNISDAEETIFELLENGVPRTSISYIYMDNLGRVEEHDAKEALHREGDTLRAAGNGAYTGALAGGAVGALAGLAVVSGLVPGIGALFIGGPLATYLGLGGATAAVTSGVVTGVATGTVVGALVGLGLSEPDAQLYEEWIKKGDIVVSATSNRVDVRVIFEDHNADNIREHTQ
jgi:hypothetical protein